MRVLVAEDQEDSRVFLEMNLQLHGHDVISCTSGREALDIARQDPPDLVISDALMPEMDGFELCRQMKRDYRLSTVPFIMYTGTFVDRRDEELAISLGVSRFLTKPMEPDALLKAIADVLATSQDATTPGTPTDQETEARILQAHRDTLARKLDAKAVQLESERTALRTSEARFHHLVESLERDYYFYSRGTDGVITYVSPSIHDILGYEPSEFLVHYSEYLTSNKTNREVAVHAEAAVHGEKRPAYEAEIFHKDGTPRWLEIIEISVTDNRGEVVAVEGIAHDITNQKHSSEAVAKLASQNALILESAGEGIYGLDHEGNLTFINPTAIQMLGVNVEGLLGTDIDSLWHHARPGDSSHPENRSPISDVLRTGVSSSGEEYFVREDKTSFPVEFISNPIIDKGEITGAVVSFMDITELKRSEEALTRQRRAITLNNRIANIFLTSPSEKNYDDVLDVLLETLDSRFGYFGFIDDDGSLVCRTMTSHTEDQFQDLGKSFTVARTDWGSAWGQSLTEKKTLVATGDLQLPEGNVKLDCALIVPIIHHDTAVGQFVMANKPGCYDRYDRELLESAATQTAPILNALLDEARQRREHERLEDQLRQAQKMEAIGTLAGGIAHDFNNILGAMIGFTELALGEIREGIVPDETNLEEILRAGDRAKDLVQQILSFSRRQAGREKIPVDLGVLVNEALKLLRGALPGMVEIQNDIVNDGATVLADPTQMHQIVMNLCTNSWQAMEDQGGTLTVEVKGVDLGPAESATYAKLEPGPYVRLMISDTGIGIIEEELNRIFEPFYTTKRKKEGTGMGLAVVHGIVQSHGGSITVESEVGKGSTFTVLLPGIATEEEATEADIETFSGGTEHILLVDDEELLCKVMSRLLTSLGYLVTVQSSGREALDTFLAEPDSFDLVFADLAMPKMTGMELAAKIHSIRKETPIILCTGYGEKVTEEEMHSAGIRRILIKPLRKRELAAELRQILDKNS